MPLPAPVTTATRAGLTIWGLLAENGVPLDDLLAARPDTDDRDAGADTRLHELDEPLGVHRKVGEGTAAADVLLPTGQRLEDRNRVVEVGLADRHLLDPLAVDLVGHAD